MIIKEFRIPMPLSIDEYQIGQLYSVAQASLNETGGGEGIEVVANEPFENVPLLNGQYTSGQYTKKIYYLASKVPAFIRMLAPKGSLIIHEEAWNAYPYCKTLISNPGYMKEKFTIEIESLHLPDRGEQENALEVPPDRLKHREVIVVDIANDPIDPKDYKANEDPTKFHSEVAQRGPLDPNWKETCTSVMCCYKLVTAEFKWFGFQNRVENYIIKAQRRLFTNFHRQVFCWIDRWFSMTMDDIRALEERTREELEEARKTGTVRGGDKWIIFGF